MVVLFALLASSAQGVWLDSEHENSSINFTYSGFDDALLDYTTPIEFLVVYLNSSSEPIDNSSGSCFLNFTSPLTQIVELNYSENGMYSGILSESSKTLDNRFQVYCTDTANHSHDHVLSNSEGALTFQYDLYEPIIVDIFTANEAGPLVGEVPTFLAGQDSLLYLLIRNITGNETPRNITSADCNISLDGTPHLAESAGFLDFYTSRFILPETGNLPISGKCTFNQETYESLPKNLTANPLLVPNGYDLGEVDWYFQPILMAENGSESFLMSVPYIGGTAAVTQIRKLGLTMSLLLSQDYGVTKGSFGFADLFNQRDPSVIYSGKTSAENNVFSSVKSSFASETSFSDLNHLENPSLSIFDATGNGFPDTLIAGKTAEDTKFTQLLLNTGSTLSPNPSSLPNLSFASICYGDFNGDSRYDLFVSGESVSEIKTGIYLNNGTDFYLNQTLPTKLFKSTCGVGRFLDENKTSLIHFGTNSTTAPDSPENWQYVIYNDIRNWSQTTSGILGTFDGSIYGDVVIADFSNDGFSDLFICGGTSGHETLTLFINDLAESGKFVPVNPFSDDFALPECSLSAADYDFDGDLDLAYTGVGTSGEPILLFNNTASENSPNTAPIPPDFINGTWDKSSGILWLNWSAGEDSKTPTGMLSYNIEVESPTKGLLLSGQPAVSSKPFQGYLGNMQYRKNTTLYNQTPENVVVRIQSIDAGLKRSSWKEVDVFWDECTPTKNWEISGASGCTLPSMIQDNSIVTIKNASTLTAGTTVDLGTNTTLFVENGTLDLTESTLLGNNSAIFIKSDGRFLATATRLLGINLSIDSTTTLTDCELDYFFGNASAEFVNTTWNSLNTTASVDVRFYFEPNFRDQFGEVIQNVSIRNESHLLNFSSRLNLTGYLLTNTSSIPSSHNLTFQKNGYYNHTSLLTLTGNLAPEIILNKEPAPITAGFNVTGIPAGLGSSYFADLTTLSNVSHVAIQKIGVGFVSFLEPVNLSFVNLSQVLLIQKNSISLNSSLAPGLNKSAQLRFENLTFQTQPIVLRNGNICTQCSEQSFNENILSITVPGFSTYTLTNNSQISLSSPSVLFNNTLSNFSVTYHAYETASAIIENASCTLTIGANTVPLNETNGSHFATIQINSIGEKTVSVSCSGNSSFEPINETITLTVVRNGAYFLKDSEFLSLRYSNALFGNISGIIRFFATGHLIDKNSDRASVSYPSGFSLDNDYGSAHSALADLNNDGWNDLLIMGTTASGTAFDWYDNQTQKQSIGLELSNGDFEVLDIDFDGDLDILACGKNSSDEPKTILLKNQISENNHRETVEFIKSSPNLPNVEDCSLEFEKGTSENWLILSGINESGGNIASAYRLTKNGFQEIQELGSWQLPELSALLHDFTQDGRIDLILAGRADDRPNAIFFDGTGSGFTLNQGLSSQLTNFSEFGTRLAVGRLTNATEESLLISGITNTGLQILAYGFNGTDFVEQDLALDVTPTYQGTLTLGDIDSDSDLDLWITGQSTTGPITHLYTNTLAEYAGLDEPPSPPSSIEATYSNETLHLNWSAGTDNETSPTLLSYSLKIGSSNEPNLFLSGTRQSFASGKRVGNQGSALAANLTLPNACFFVQAQSIDSAQQESVWSDLLIANNHSEICNGYDNDCDGEIDEDFVYEETNLFIYNGSLNGTPFVCTFYEENFPEQLSCPNDPTKSQGSACLTETYSGAVYVWNTTSKTCDCDTSNADLKNVQVNSVRSSSGSATAFVPKEEQTEAVLPEETKNEIQPTESTKESSSRETDHFTTSLPGFEIVTTAVYQDGRTLVFNEIKNTERTRKENIYLRIEFSDKMANFVNDLRSTSNLERTNANSITAKIDSLEYLEKTVFLYSVPEFHDLSDIESSELSITSKSSINETLLAKIEAEEQKAAETSITSNVSETVLDNKTVIRLEIDLKENISQVHGVEIEQSIPKCLIEEITDSVLEAAIDPELLDHVEIKETDPLLVWRFDRLEDAVNLDLTLDTLRSADCDDKVSLRLLAKSFIYQNHPIKPFSVFMVLLLSLSLAFLTLSPVILSARHKFHKHDNPHVVRLAKIILRRRHQKIPDTKIIRDLKKNDESKEDIDAALKHLDQHQPSHHGLTLYEHRVEIVLFISVLFLSIMEMGGVLPGYLDWFKKVLSWVIMLLVVHHANLARLFFNEEAPKFSVSLMIGMFLMHLVRLAEFASDGLTESVGFVFDWYVLIVRLDSEYHLSWILFALGLVILTGCAIYGARKLPVRERSLASIFFKHPEPKGRLALIGRFLGLWIIFCVFFFSVFNRLIEWLAIAVDSTLFVLTAITLMAVSLSMIAHHKGHHSHHHLEKFGELLADGYLVWLGIAVAVFSLVRPLFAPELAELMIGGLVTVLILTLLFVVLKLKKLHELDELEKIPLALDHLYEKFIRLLRYPKTLALALAGLPILQLVVESALYIIPNITGTASHLYEGHSAETLLSFFNNSGLVTQQLFMMPLPQAIILGCMYIASLLGLLLLLVMPVWVWVMAYRHRGKKLASVLEWLKEKNHWTEHTGYFLMVMTLPLGILYLKNPVLRIIPRYTEGSAGVHFVPRLLEISMTEAVTALGVCLAGALLIASALKFQKTRSKMLSFSTGLSFSLLFGIYFMPFVESLWEETVSLFSGNEPALLKGTAWLLGSLQFLDIVLVYGIGGLCAIYLIMPQGLKQEAIETLKKLRFFRRIFSLSGSTHLLEYYDEAKGRFAGNLLHHLEHFIRQGTHNGVLKKDLRQITKEHGYPPKLISKAIRQVLASKHKA